MDLKAEMGEGEAALRQFVAQAEADERRVYRTRVLRLGGEGLRIGQRVIARIARDGA